MQWFHEMISWTGSSSDHILCTYQSKSFPQPHFHQTQLRWPLHVDIIPWECMLCSHKYLGLLYRSLHQGGIPSFPSILTTNKQRTSWVGTYLAYPLIRVFHDITSWLSRSSNTTHASVSGPHFAYMPIKALPRNRSLSFPSLAISECNYWISSQLPIFEQILKLLSKATTSGINPPICSCLRNSELLHKTQSRHNPTN